MTTTASDRALDPPDDDAFITEILARRRRRTPLLTLALVVALAAAAAFVAGAEAQKHYGHSSSSSSSSSSNGNIAALAAARAGGATFRGLGGGGGRGSGNLPAFAGGGATVGTVTLIKGNTLYVTDSSGNTVLVHASATSNVTKSVPGTVKTILPGDTVNVLGTQRKDGSYTARSISITRGGSGGNG